MFFCKIFFLKYIQYFTASFLNHCTYTPWVFIDGVKHRAKASLALLRLLKSTGWHAAQPSLWLAVLCGLKCLQLATAVTASNFCWLPLLLPPFFLLITIRLCWPSYHLCSLLLAFLHFSLSTSLLPPIASHIS